MFFQMISTPFFSHTIISNTYMSYNAMLLLIIHSSILLYHSFVQHCDWLAYNSIILTIVHYWFHYISVIKLNTAYIIKKTDLYFIFPFFYSILYNIAWYHNSIFKIAKDIKRSTNVYPRNFHIFTYSYSSTISKI